MVEFDGIIEPFPSAVSLCSRRAIESTCQLFRKHGTEGRGDERGSNGSLIVVYLHGGLERLEFTAAGEDVELPEVVASHAKFLEFRACLIND